MQAIIYTLGCKVNTYESAEISENLRKNGYLIAPQGANIHADVYIVNSCTVTGESNRKTRQLIRKLKREHPEAITVLTGCMPQAFPEEAAELTQADIVIGNKSNSQIPALIEEFRKSTGRLLRTEQHESGETFSGDIISSTEGHTRAFLKIQDGCNRFCSYCIIPTARGRSRSRQLEEIRRSARMLSENGFREIVLVGINLSAYGRDLGDLSMADAVMTAAEPDGIRRVRLGSLEPDHITPEMIEKLSACKKLCPQFHISLQSGSDAVLKRMNRHYTAAEYEATVRELRRVFPNCSITTDIICGFPGETDGEFAETVAFAEKIGFEKVHIFPYSVREGTRAANMSGQIPKAIKEQRCAVLAEVCEKSRKEFMHSLIGSTTDVLFETPKNGMQKGYTANYVPITVKQAVDKDICGQLLPVHILSVEGDNCIGELTI